jgi:AcrR family transcriptional regulator
MRVRETKSPASQQVSEIQRLRLLAAAVAVVDQLGYGNTTVTHITSRARISRRTFYELFENREDCLAGMFEYGIDLLGTELATVAPATLPWRERIRAGLWSILSFLDREPALARVCVVQTLRGDQQVLDRRTEVLAELASVVDDGRKMSSRGGNLASLTAEGLVGAAHAIVYARLLRREREPLTDLLGDLMGMIALPYLGSDVARREQVRAVPTPEPSATRSEEGISEAFGAEGNPLEGIRMRVTYRTALVLQHIAERPGISNREVADRAGISDQGQMSKLLSRLRRLGLIVNSGQGHTKGEPNAWTLTGTGSQVAQSILVPIPSQTVAS